MRITLAVMIAAQMALHFSSMADILESQVRDLSSEAELKFRNLRSHSANK